MTRESMMNSATRRSIIRWIHLILAIPIAGYIYSPFDQIPNYAHPTRYVFFPLMVLSGLLLWKGHLLRRVFSK
jgi:thiosulfate reductase cytochrome b subunit